MRLAPTSSARLDRGSRTRPAHHHPGSRYFAPSPDPADADWDNIKGCGEGVEA